MAITDDIYVASAIEYQSSNLWDFYILDNAITGLSGLAEAISGVSGPFLKFLTKSVTFPGFSFDMERNPDFSTHHVGYNDPATVSVSFYETNVFSTFRYLKSWMDSIYDTTTKTFKRFTGDSKFKTGIAMFYANVYNSAALAEATSTSQFLQSVASSIVAPNLIIVFNNLTIKSVSDFSLSEESSGPLFIDAEFECDIPKVVF